MLIITYVGNYVWRNVLYKSHPYFLMSLEFYTQFCTVYSACALATCNLHLVAIYLWNLNHMLILWTLSGVLGWRWLALSRACALPTFDLHVVPVFLWNLNDMLILWTLFLVYWVGDDWLWVTYAYMCLSSIANYIIDVLSYMPIVYNIVKSSVSEAMAIGLLVVKKVFQSNN